MLKRGEGKMIVGLLLSGLGLLMILMGQFSGVVLLFFGVPMFIDGRREDEWRHQKEKLDGRPGDPR
jgi:hypothetical protein